MHKIRKAVIPAAGWARACCPPPRPCPKRCCPSWISPPIQYIVEEAVAAGIEEILIITGRGKAIMEDHFDHAFELERNLEANPAKAQMLEQCLGIANLADIFFLRQKETKGLGHAILKAKPFTADEPFVVLYGDDVIMGDDPRGRAAYPRLWPDGQTLRGHQGSEPRGHSQIFLHEMHPHQR